MTAVEFIKEKLLGNEYWYEDMTFDQIIEQAKEMEKEQTMDFAMKFMMQDRPIVSFYNETFKSEESS